MATKLQEELLDQALDAFNHDLMQTVLGRWKDDFLSHLPKQETSVLESLVRSKWEAKLDEKLRKSLFAAIPSPSAISHQLEPLPKSSLFSIVLPPLQRIEGLEGKPALTVPFSGGKVGRWATKLSAVPQHESGDDNDSDSAAPEPQPPRLKRRRRSKLNTSSHSPQAGAVMLGMRLHFPSSFITSGQSEVMSGRVIRIAHSRKATQSSAAGAEASNVPCDVILRLQSGREVKLAWPQPAVSANQSDVEAYLSTMTDGIVDSNDAHDAEDAMDTGDMDHDEEADMQVVAPVSETVAASQAFQDLISDWLGETSDFATMGFGGLTDMPGAEDVDPMDASKAPLARPKSVDTVMLSTGLLVSERALHDVETYFQGIQGRTPRISVVVDEASVAESVSRLDLHADEDPSIPLTEPDLLIIGKAPTMTRGTDEMYINLKDVYLRDMVLHRDRILPEIRLRLNATDLSGSS